MKDVIVGRTWASIGLPSGHPLSHSFVLHPIGERKDFAVSDTTKRDELLDELLTWQASINAPLPGRPRRSRRKNNLLPDTSVNFQA